MEVQGHSQERVDHRHVLRLLVDRGAAYGASLVTKVNVPTAEEAALVGDRMLLSFIWPAQNPDLLAQLQAQKATVFAMD